MNITFPALACEDLHVDAMDVAGDSQLDVEDTLVKKQLRLDGSMRSMDEIAVEMNGHRQEQEKKQRILKKALPEGYCGPCFGAQKPMISAVKRAMNCWQLTRKRDGSLISCIHGGAVHS
ncbi:Endoplasmic Reticulum-Golgi Intermediate Compartment (ERGIC) [Fragilaria crotonensis]|nr:Endoplasmic Reticulum-Golgi Intermediate Compartment (ERGIC) [Fragilaria crotonensis]